MVLLSKKSEETAKGMGEALPVGRIWEMLPFKLSAERRQNSEMLKNSDQ